MCLKTLTLTSIPTRKLAIYLVDRRALEKITCKFLDSPRLLGTPVLIIYSLPGEDWHSTTSVYVGRDKVRFTVHGAKLRECSGYFKEAHANGLSRVSDAVDHVDEQAGWLHDMNISHFATYMEWVYGDRLYLQHLKLDLEELPGSNVDSKLLQLLRERTPQASVGLDESSLLTSTSPYLETKDTPFVRRLCDELCALWTYGVHLRDKGFQDAVMSSLVKHSLRPFLVLGAAESGNNNFCMAPSTLHRVYRCTAKGSKLRKTPLLTTSTDKLG